MRAVSPSDASNEFNNWIWDALNSPPSPSSLNADDILLPANGAAEAASAAALQDFSITSTCLSLVAVFSRTVFPNWVNRTQLIMLIYG